MSAFKLPVVVSSHSTDSTGGNGSTHPTTNGLNDADSDKTTKTSDSSKEVKISDTSGSENQEENLLLLPADRTASTPTSSGGGGETSLSSDSSMHYSNYRSLSQHHPSVIQTAAMVTSRISPISPPKYGLSEPSTGDQQSQSHYTQHTSVISQIGDVSPAHYTNTALDMGNNSHNNNNNNNNTSYVNNNYQWPYELSPLNLRHKPEDHHHHQQHSKQHETVIADGRQHYYTGSATNEIEHHISR